MTKSSGISGNAICLYCTVYIFDLCYCGLLTGDAGKVLKKKTKTIIGRGTLCQMFDKLSPGCGPSGSNGSGYAAEEPARCGCRMI